MLSILKLHGIVVLRDLWDLELGWKPIGSFHVSSRPTRHGDDQGLVWLLDKDHGLVAHVNDLALQNSDGWVWKVSKKLISSWCFPNNSWRIILSTPCSDFQKLNSRWESHLSVVEWIKFWKRL